MVKKGEEVTPVNNAQAMTFGGLPEMPAYIEKSQNGLEDVDAKTDVIVPRLKIAYLGSKEHKENDVPIGHFTTNLFGTDLGTKVRFVVLRIVPGWLMFDGVGGDAKLISRKFNNDVIPPLEEGLVLNPENQKWQTVEKTDPRNPKEKLKVQEKPKASRVFMYIGLLNGKIPVALTLASTALTEAKQVNSKLMTANVPAYACSFMLEAREATDGSNIWYIPTFVPERWNTEEEIAEYKKFYDKFKDKRTDVKIEDDAVAGSEKVPSGDEKEEKF